MAKKRSGKRSSSSGIPSPYLVMGRNSVSVALEHRGEEVRQFYIVKSFAARDDLGKKLVRSAEALSINVQYRSREQLSEILGSDSHQSCACELLPPKAWDLGELLASFVGVQKSWLLLMDAVQDPQNFGTLLRVAECFSADAAIWSPNRCAPLSPVATKASVGASELLCLSPSSNLVESMRTLKDAGYWIVGTDAGETSTALSTFEFPEKSAIVLGAEGRGMSRLTRELCDFHVRIPMSGDLESLNVSQAAAITAYTYSCQHIDLLK